jgi:hydrogen peroxide-dependent heme synthase
MKVEPIDQHLPGHNKEPKPLPAAPLTIEGASVLHQILRFRRAAWRGLPESQRRGMVEEASAVMRQMETRAEGESAFYSVVGHKGDLLFLHFRKTVEELKEAELALQQLALSEYLEPSTSYLSVVELGLYESSVRLYAKLVEQGLEPFTPQWNQEVEDTLARQRQAMSVRLWPPIPKRRYLCFYPMDRKRGEVKNWYQVPMGERQRMMHEHGLVGRRYAGEVRQIISGSIGLDDWEWGVDLFADDPVVFKRLIYEMRFDEVSAVYALFGAFYIGIRFDAANLGTLLEGRLPAFESVPDAEPEPGGPPAGMGGRPMPQPA